MYPFKEMLTGFYPSNAPKLEGGPLTKFFFLCFVRFILFVGSGAFTLYPPASSACALLYRSNF
jgi:hypothetical protein